MQITLVPSVYVVVSDSVWEKVGSLTCVRQIIRKKIDLPRDLENDRNLLAQEGT